MSVDKDLAGWWLEIAATGSTVSNHGPRMFRLTSVPMLPRR